MKNTNYYNEIVLANNFVLNHLYDKELLAILKDIENPDYKHSERWSIIYDFMIEHYPGATGSLITGLAYRAEM